MIRSLQAHVWAHLHCQWEIISIFKYIFLLLLPCGRVFPELGLLTSLVKNGLLERGSAFCNGVAQVLPSIGFTALRLRHRHGCRPPMAQLCCWAQRWGLSSGTSHWLRRPTVAAGLNDGPIERVKGSCLGNLDTSTLFASHEIGAAASVGQ